MLQSSARAHHGNDLQAGKVDHVLFSQHLALESKKLAAVQAKFKEVSRSPPPRATVQLASIA